MSSSPTLTVHWFRWHHGTVSDPKWRVVARKASHALSRTVTVANVISVWAAMLECASQANPRGELIGWSDEDVAAGLDLDEDEVRVIREAMQEKTLQATAVIAWNARQPRREDPSAAERKQRQRERASPAESRSVTRILESKTCQSRNVTLEERRGEEIRGEEAKASTPDGVEGDSAGAPSPPTAPGEHSSEDDKGAASPAIPDCPHDEIIELYHEILPMCPPVRVWEGARQNLLRTRWREDAERQNLGWWRGYFEWVKTCPFLVGKKDPGPDREPFLATLEWLVKPSNFAKVIEGNYRPRRAA